jgi:hypothetical protein
MENLGIVDPEWLVKKKREFKPTKGRHMTSIYDIYTKTQIAIENVEIIQDDAINKDRVAHVKGFRRFQDLTQDYRERHRFTNKKFDSTAEQMSDPNI